MRGIASRQSAPVLLGIASFAAILLVWESVVRLGWVNPFFVSQPSAIAASLSQQARSGELRHTASALKSSMLTKMSGEAVVFAALCASGRERVGNVVMSAAIWFIASAAPWRQKGPYRAP